MNNSNKLYSRNMGILRDDIWPLCLSLILLHLSFLFFARTIWLSLSLAHVLCFYHLLSWHCFVCVSLILSIHLMSFYVVFFFFFLFLFIFFFLFLSYYLLIRVRRTESSVSVMTWALSYPFLVFYFIMRIRIIINNL